MLGNGHFSPREDIRHLCKPALPSARARVQFWPRSKRFFFGRAPRVVSAGEEDSTSHPRLQSNLTCHVTDLSHPERLQTHSFKLPPSPLSTALLWGERGSGATFLIFSRIRPGNPSELWLDNEPSPAFPVHASIASPLV